MAINTWNGSTSTDWNTAANWTTTGVTDRVPTSADDVIIPDTTGGSINNCELSATGGNPKNVNSLKLEANGTLIGNDIEIRVYGEGNGSGGTTDGYAVDLDGIVSGNLHLKIQTAAETALDLTPSSGNVKNLTINHASCDAGIDNSVTLTGDLTVELGIFEIGNYAFQLVNYAESGSGRVEMYNNTVTCTGDWKGPNTKLMANGPTFNITGKVGGAWDCNGKENVAINCASFHSTIAMSNGDGIRPRDGSDSGANLNEGGTLSAGDTTLTVQANSIDDNDYIRINTEVMKVTAGGGTTTLTVQRGQMHTNATTHADGSDIYDLGSNRQVTIEEKTVLTATATQSNAPVYGPLQGKINLVTNSSGSKDFEMKEDLEVNGRVIVTGSGEFRTYTSSNTYDLLIDGATATDDQNGNDGSGYSCLDIRDSAKFLSGSSSVILDAALGSNICDVGTWDSGTTGWTAYTDSTVSNDSGTIKILKDDDSSNTNGAYLYFNSTSLSTSGLTIGKVYKFTCRTKVNQNSTNLKLTTQNASTLPFGNENETSTYLNGATTRTQAVTSTSWENRTAYFVAGYETTVYLYANAMATGDAIWIDDVTIQQVYANGNSGFIAPDSHTIAEDHKQSYGLDIAGTSTVCDLGTGFYYSCGSRIGNKNHTKASGRYCCGSGDSTEYFTGGGGTLDFNSTDIILLGNSGATSTIGFNVGDWTWNCRSFCFYLPSASNWLVYWLHQQNPTVNSATSSTAAKTHTINGDVHILKGKLYNSYTDSDRTGVGLVYGDTVIYDDGELNLNVTDSVNDHVDCSFNSIILKNGGALMATPKTITITDQAGSGYSFQNLTTVAKSPKNGGTFKFTDNAHCYCQESNFYNLEVALDTSSLEFRWHDSSGSIVTIDNNFIMTSGRFKFNTAGDAITVHGNTSMTSSAQYGIGSPSGVHTFNGAVRLDGGTWYMSSGTNNYNGGIRNIGATLS